MSIWGRTPPTKPGWYWCWWDTAEEPCPLFYDGNVWSYSSGLPVYMVYMTEGVRFGPEVQRPEEP